MLAIDWGLSTFRAWRLADDGGVLGHIAAARGIRSVAPGGFATALSELLAAWREARSRSTKPCG